MTSPAFIYVALEPGPASVWTDRFDYFNSGRILLETQLNDFNVNLADRRDLGDGRRIYRVWPQDQFRLPSDARGYYLIDSRTQNGKFRFTTTNPSGNALVVRQWTNYRS